MKIDISKGSFVKKMLVINDNHVDATNGQPAFVNSQFHKFLVGFTSLELTLSSPVIGHKLLNSSSMMVVDGVKVVPRLAFITTFRYYVFFIFYFFYYFLHYLILVDDYDIVMIVQPASSGLPALLASRLRRKYIVMYVVGDVNQSVKTTVSKRLFFLRRISVLVSQFEFAITKMIAKNNVTFALGNDMKKKLSDSGADRIFPAMTSLIEEKDIKTGTFNWRKGMLCRLVTVSRLSKEKNIEVVIHAIFQLKQSGVDIHYKIIGAGPEHSRLSILINELKLQDNISLLGQMNKNDVIRFGLSNSDIFILPSLSEGMPKVLLEAMAAGVLIVANRVGGIEDIIGNEQQRGYLINEDDSSSNGIASIVTQILLDDSYQENNKKLLNAENYIREHTLNKEAQKIEHTICAIFFGSS